LISLSYLRSSTSPENSLFNLNFDWFIWCKPVCTDDVAITWGARAPAPPDGLARGVSGFQLHHKRFLSS
jgi:hypothetical protein